MLNETTVINLQADFSKVKFAQVEKVKTSRSNTFMYTNYIFSTPSSNTPSKTKCSAFNFIKNCIINIKPSTTVHNLDVLLDSELSLKQHINKVVSSRYE